MSRRPLSLLSWLAVLAVLKSPEAEATQRFLSQPENATVQLGQTLTLSCRFVAQNIFTKNYQNIFLLLSVENLVGPLQWTKDDFGLGTLRSLPGYER